MPKRKEIDNYISCQPKLKRNDMQTLHQIILQIMPTCKLWYLDGKDSNGKTVSNPNIGYGLMNIKSANGTIKEFYQIGMSANTIGISIYIMGIKDKTFLTRTFGEKIGKAYVSSYCIKFKKLNDINLEILELAIEYGINQSKIP